MESVVHSASHAGLLHVPNKYEILKDDPRIKGTSSIHEINVRTIPINKQTPQHEFWTQYNRFLKKIDLIGEVKKQGLVSKGEIRDFHPEAGVFEWSGKKPCSLKTRVPIASREVFKTHRTSSEREDRYQMFGGAVWGQSMWIKVDL